MALPKNMSIDELKRKNDASQTARAAEKGGSAPNGKQQTGR